MSPVLCILLSLPIIAAAPSLDRSQVGDDALVERAFFGQPTLGTLSTTVTNDIIHYPRFNRHDPTAMVSAERALDTLRALPLSLAVDRLAHLRTSLGGPTPFTDHVTRRLLHEHHLPAYHQSIPSLFFSHDVLAGPITHEPPTSTPANHEYRVSWWREDTGYAEHHHAWHQFHPAEDTTGHADRQGELFAYLHLQMLARYATERAAVGLEPAQPLKGWEYPVVEGYNPRLSPVSFRAAGMKAANETRLGPSRVIHSAEVWQQRQLVLEAVKRGYFTGSDGSPMPITMNLLGHTVEATETGSVNPALYGGLHNDGHVILAGVNDPGEVHGIPCGPMIHTATAPRDPVFYRWHTAVDDIFEAHRRLLHPWKEGEVRVPGISVERVGVVTGAEEDRLYTRMERGSYYVRLHDRNVTKDQMTHDPYKLQIGVRVMEEREVVFRVFLLPGSGEQSFTEKRRSAIEIDRFVRKLQPGFHMIEQADSGSSVIHDPPATGHRCGWPLRTLIPRGSPSGMPFTLFVLATDWTLDKAGEGAKLGRSVCLCGVGKGDIYPDSRPMGFPFDREVSGEGVLEGLENVGYATVTITLQGKVN